ARTLPPDLMSDRTYWLQKLLWPTASAALDYPEHEAALKALFIEVSSQDRAFKREKEHANGFNVRAAEAQWEQALRETAQRRAAGRETVNIHSLLHAAKDAGWVAPDAEPVKPAPFDANDLAGATSGLLAEHATGFDLGTALIEAPPPPR